MNSSYIPIFILLFLLVILPQQRMQQWRQHRIITRNRKEGYKMAHPVEAYLGKECIVYTMNSQIGGTIRTVSDGWIAVDNGKDTEVINLDYIIRVRECPRKKNGKKKTVVLD